MNLAHKRCIVFGLLAVLALLLGVIYWYEDAVDREAHEAVYRSLAPNPSSAVQQ